MIEGAFFEVLSLGCAIAAWLFSAFGIIAVENK